MLKPRVHFKSYLFFIVHINFFMILKLEHMYIYGEKVANICSIISPIRFILKIIIVIIARLTIYNLRGRETFPVFIEG